MSIGRGDGITLHKITNVPTLIAKKTCHMDPDSLENAGSESVLGGGILKLHSVWTTLTFPIFYSFIVMT